MIKNFGHNEIWEGKQNEFGGHCLQMPPVATSLATTTRPFNKCCIC